MSKLVGPIDLTDEQWREYVLPERIDPYRITSPQKLWYSSQGNRVLDKEGIVHYLPAPGVRGTVLRWKPRDPENPVQF